MKKVLIVCLLGMGLLLPEAAHSNKTMAWFFKVVNVNLIGWTLHVTSDETSGTLVSTAIYNSTNSTLLLTQSCSGYSCDIDVSSLGSGTFYARITTTHGTTTKRYVVV